MRRHAARWGACLSLYSQCKYSAYPLRLPSIALCRVEVPPHRAELLARCMVVAGLAVLGYGKDGGCTTPGRPAVDNAWKAFPPIFKRVSARL